ncbi:MAG TPA: hypothetical protein PLU49_14040 [Saprospiraceae bacterium]|nr:hypothetical protein [Saprospiraceae bacterium]
MKTLIFVFYIFIFSFTFGIFSQDLSGGDVKVSNPLGSGKTLYVRVYPVSMIFNADEEYDLQASNPILNRFTFLNGRNIDEDKFEILPGNLTGWNADWVTDPGGSVGGLGVGAYKFEFYWDGPNNLKDTCVVEFDYGFWRDLTFHYDPGDDKMKYFFDYCNTTNIDLPQNRRIESWNNQCTTRTRVRGDFVYDANNNNNYIILPQDFRQDCSNENHDTLISTNRTGYLTNNLFIDKNVFSRNIVNTSGNYMLEPPTEIIIGNHCNLKINSGKAFVLETDYYFDENPIWHTRFHMLPFSTVEILQNNAQLIFKRSNHLYLDCDSKIIIGKGSKLEMQTGSKLCMSGGTVSGPGQFIISGFIKRLQCLVPCVEDNIFMDSTKLIIEQNADFEIPDSTTFIFKGKETALICNDSSTIKFGKGSKLIFEDGARISANGCKFVSYDSTQTWDGIYLSDDANDTIKNCVIQNAYNGINVSEPSSISLTNYTTEITNCTFKNSTSTQLLNQVYIDGSSGVLVKGCST